MNFTAGFSSKELEFVKEAFISISKYSSGEIIITDEKFNIIFRNSKYVKKNKKVNFLDLEENFLTGDFINNIRKFKASDKNHMFIKMIFNDNGNLSNLPVDVHICKIKNKKNILKGFTIIIQDITQEVRNRIQRETFIDILTHDLRNPIRANVQILDLILKNKFGSLDNNVRVILDELLNSCRFMNYMAENLIIKYKNEFNMYELNKQKYSITKLIKDKCNDLINIFERKHQTIEFIVNGNVNEINIDVGAIGKVINNLLINASEQSLENSKIIIQIEENKDNIIVSFTDSGYIRNTEDTNDIFEEYFTCSNKFRKIGFGLEFYNCKKIIEAHKGIISAVNGKTKGTSITFSLPVCG